MLNKEGKVPTYTKEQNKIADTILTIARKHLVGKTINHADPYNKSLTLFYKEWQQGFKLYEDLIDLRAKTENIKLDWRPSLRMIVVNY